MTRTIAPGRRSIVVDFLRCDAAAVSLVTAFALIVMIGMAAVSIDGGKYYLLRRTQQTATDFSALAAASNLANATNLAVQAGTVDNFSAAAVSSVELGSYAQDSTIPVAQRFKPTTTSPNAVRVTMATQPPFIFGGMLSALTTGKSDQPGFTVRTRAIAVNQNLASFSLRTQLAGLNGGIENALLGALLGSQVSLSLNDYNALAGANIDLFSFAQALNTRANLNAVTYASVAQSTVRLPQALGALTDVLGGSGTAGAALSRIVAATATSTAAIPVGSLISFGSTGASLLTATTHPISANLSALDLLATLLEVANGGRQVSGSFNAGLPGIASVSFSLAIGQPTVSASMTAIGPQGTTLHSAQTRVRLSVTLLGAPPASLVNLPLYLEVASGTATATSLQCSVPSSPGAVLNVQPGVATAYIGTVSDSDFGNLAAPPSVSNAVFLNLLNTVQVVGTAQATISNTTPVPVSFTASDIAAGAWKTTSTTDFTSSLYSSLLNNLNLQTRTLGFSVGVPSGLTAAVGLTLSGASSSIDLLINQVLGALGVTVGNASTSVDAVRCGVSVLAG